MYLYDNNKLEYEEQKQCLIIKDGRVKSHPTMDDGQVSGRD